MAILTEIPRRQRFDDFSERGAFHSWMKHSIIFAVIACIAALLITYFVDSRTAKNKEKVPEKEKTSEKLPVVADLPMKAKPIKAPTSGTSTKSSKSGSSTTKKAGHPPSQHKTIQEN